MIFCKTIVAILLSWFVFFAVPSRLKASDWASYSVQFLALAPNSGGQEAYTFRRAANKREISVFANNYLYAGEYPLLGGFYSWRFSVLDNSWPLQAFTQLGLGVTTAGPAAEILWGSIFLWTARIDIATQAIISQKRIIMWSYPIWIGVSLPLPF